MNVALDLLAKDPSQYIDLKDATLVQSMNGQESVASIMQVSRFVGRSARIHWSLQSNTIVVTLIYCMKMQTIAAELLCLLQLVQSRELPDSCYSSLQVLRPISRLMHSPEVYNSVLLSEEQRHVVKVIMQPLFKLLEGSIKANRSGEIYRRADHMFSLQ